MLKDDFETRIMLIFFHFSIILLRFKKKSKKKFPQSYFDNIFLNIEYHIRELGYGDIAVNKKMKMLNKIFYDILLKIDSSRNDKFLFNEKLFIKLLTLNTEKKPEIVTKLSNYFNSFYDFCFELDDDIMLKGQINFKN